MIPKINCPSNLTWIQGRSALGHFFFPAWRENSLASLHENIPFLKWSHLQMKSMIIIYYLLNTSCVLSAIFFLKSEKNTKPTQTTGDNMVDALGLNNPHQIQHAIHLWQDWNSDCNSGTTGSSRSFMIIENLHKIFWPKNVIKMNRIQEGQLKRKEAEKWQIGFQSETQHLPGWHGQASNWFWQGKDAPGHRFWCQHVSRPSWEYSL